MNHGVEKVAEAGFEKIDAVLRSHRPATTSDI
jgi:hypothetical protein